MYGHPYYGPPQMWGPPTMNMQPTPDQYQAGMQFAIKLAAREEREKERKKHREKREREDSAKKFADSRRRFLVATELYILGIISQPFVLFAYNHMLTNLK